MLNGDARARLMALIQSAADSAPPSRTEGARVNEQPIVLVEPVVPIFDLRRSSRASQRVVDVLRSAQHELLAAIDQTDLDVVHPGSHKQTAPSDEANDNDAEAVVEIELTRNDEGRIGIGFDDMTINDIESGSPAQLDGRLCVNDTLTAVNGHKCRTMKETRSAFGSKSKGPGETVKLTITRQKQQQQPPSADQTAHRPARTSPPPAEHLPEQHHQQLSPHPQQLSPPPQQRPHLILRLKTAATANAPVKIQPTLAAQVASSSKKPSRESAVLCSAALNQTVVVQCRTCTADVRVVVREHGYLHGGSDCATPSPSRASLPVAIARPEATSASDITCVRCGTMHRLRLYP